MGNKLHGYTRITLRNPISGNIIKDVESENTFQGSVIAQYLRTLGTNGGIMNNAETKGNPLWQKIVGGLFLFQNTEQVGNMYMSAGNRMIGNGSYGLANASDPPELGTFNGNESSATASAITQVYDFATNQANGTIGCVSLTSQVGGFLGYGNPSKKVHTATARWQWQIQSYQDVQGADTVNVEDGYRYAAVGNTNFRFTYDSTNHVIKVRKSKVPVSKASVFDWLIDEVSIDVSSIYTEMGNALPRVACCSAGKIYLYPTGDSNVASGGTWKYWVYDPDDDSITSETFTNTASHAINTDLFSVAHGIICMHNQTNGYEMSLFDVESGVHKGDYSIVEEGFPTGYGCGRDFSLGELPQGLCCGGVYIYNLGDTRRAAFSIFDPVRDELLPCNGIPFYASNGVLPYYYDSESNVVYEGTRYFTAKCNNPLYLATINNLNSPVTKTSAQTMKVTYTLTEA